MAQTVIAVSPDGETPAANSSFTGIAASMIVGNQITIVRSPPANAAFIGIDGGVIWDKAIIPSPPAITNFECGIPVATIRTVLEMPIANSAFNGLAATFVGSYVNSPISADISFTGIVPATVSCAKAIIPSPPAITNFEGSSGAAAFTCTVLRYAITVVSPPANTAFEGLSGILGDIIVSPASITQFVGIEGIAGVRNMMLINDNLAAYDNAITSWILPVSESLVSVDLLGVERLLNILEYGTIGDTISTQWNGIKSISENLTFLDVADIVKIFYKAIDDALSVTDNLVCTVSVIINEYLAFKDSIQPYVKLNTELNDSINAVDNILALWLISVSESLVCVDALTLQSIIFINDYAALRDSLNSAAKFSKSLSDGISAVDSAIANWLISVSESLAATDNLSIILPVLISDYINARDSLEVISKYSCAVSESVLAIDNLLSIWLFEITESLGIAGAVDILRRIYDSVDDNIKMVDVLSVLGAWTKSIEDGLSADDTASVVFYLTEEISESLSVADTASILALISVIISESLVSADTVSAVKKSYLLINDSFKNSDTVLSQSKFGVSIMEMLNVNISIIIDGDVYECYVLNTSNFHPSVYSGFDFNSYCVFGDRAFGANAQGVWEITGDTDNNSEIKTGLVFHDTTFGIPQRKRFRKAYIDVSGNDPVMIMESDGVRKVYHIDDNGKFTSSRDIVGKQWTLSIANFDYIESAVLVPVVLARGN